MRERSRLFLGSGILTMALATVACGGGDTVIDAGVDGAGTLPDARTETDAAGDANDSGVDAGTTAPDSGVDDGAVSDTDANVTEDSGTQDASVDADDGAIVEPDAGTEHDSGTEPDAAVPVGYRLEVWGFQIPTMRRRIQVAAPGYTNWQTHDPAEALAANRAIDTEIRMGLLSSPVFTDVSEAHGTTTALLVSAVDDLEDIVSFVVGFGDFDGGLNYESVGGCAPGWMTAEAIADSLATGNIQTTSCPAPTHNPSGVAMLNGDIVIEWRVVAVY